MELFQARLLKSTCHHLYGNQFGTEQSTFVIEKIFKTAIAYADAPLRLGPSLLQSLLERQRDQVAGIPVFVSSLKVSLTYAILHATLTVNSTPTCVTIMPAP